ncbi:MAG: Prepilin-type N-terminal cleavage/methylation protein [Verrucomicrobiaceae bacterium]|nr:Prepilin-type N-terminal cleavage/methylation protein [Verrucomicrobiaceae bacterium]
MKPQTASRLLWIFGSAIVAACCLTIPLRPVLGYSRNIKTQAALKDLVLGVNNYRVEYNRFPMPKDSSASVDQRLESTGKFLGVLLGKNEDGINLRGLAYIEPPMAKDGKGGLVEEMTSGPYRLTHSWGHPYVVLIDGNYDNKIDNPDRRNSRPEVRKDAPASITAGVIAYSLGPDGIEGTADDIVSWRPPLSFQQPVSCIQPTWQGVFALVVLAAMLVSIMVILGQGFWLVLGLLGWGKEKSDPTDQGSSKAS